MINASTKKKLMLICKFLLVIFPVLALTTALLQVFVKTNENQLVFAAVTGDYFYDGTDATKVQDELTNTFFVVDTRLAHHMKSVRIMHASIDENGKKFGEKEEGQAISYKYSNKCMNGSPKHCNDCIKVDANPYNQVDTLKMLMPIKDVQNGKCPIPATPGVPQLDAILSHATITGKYQSPVPTIGAMPKTTSLTMTVKHTTWLLCLLHVMLAACTFFICKANGVSGMQCFFFCMLLFFAIIAYSSRDVEMNALGSDGNLRQWTRTAILNEGVTPTSDHKFKEFEYEKVVDFFKDCTKEEGDKYTVKDKGCTEQVPAMLENVHVNGSSYWILTYISYFITLVAFLLYFCVSIAEADDDDYSGPIAQTTQNPGFNPNA